MSTIARADGPGPDFDILWPEALEDPRKFAVPIQESDPVFWSDIQNAWVVTRLDDFKEGHLDKRLCSDRIQIYLRELDPEVREKYPTVLAHIPQIISFMDAPAHTRVRSILIKAFSRRVVESLRPVTHQIIEEMLDSCDSGVEFDFMEKIAYELPSRIMMRIFGIPEEHRHDFLVMALSLGQALGGSRVDHEVWQRFETSTRRIFAIVEQLITERETHPEQDLLSAFVQAREEGNKLSHHELLSAMLSTVSAGIDTTALSSALFLKAVAGRPDLQEILRTRPEAVGNLVNELLRYPGLVKAQTRMATEDFEWHGKAIRKGDFVYFIHYAANVDPRAFDRPFEIDPARDTSESVPFGHGAHHCIGHLLARMELAEFLTQTFQRFDVEILPQKFEFIPMYAFYGFRQLAVRFSARPTVSVSPTA